MTHESTRLEHLPDEPVDRAAYTALLESVGGDAAFVAELTEVFAMDAARLLGSMRSAAEAGRAGEVARAMHQLKSSSASLGATLLPRLCSEFETEARTGPSQGLAGKIPVIEAEVSRVTIMLRALCATP
jgi:HPt (histidine-containing phosphotransfer) domain-containing protein